MTPLSQETPILRHLRHVRVAGPLTALLLGIVGLVPPCSAVAGAGTNEKRAVEDQTVDASRAGPDDTEEKDCQFPCFGYELSTELQSNGLIVTDKSVLRSSRLKPSTTLDLSFAPTDGVRLFTSVVTERQEDKANEKTAFLGGLATDISELYVKVEDAPLEVRLGKFDTSFSIASAASTALNATDLVSEIDHDERWGGDAVFAFKGAGLSQSLTAAAYASGDTLFANRSRSFPSAHGLSLANGLTTFSLLLDGCKGAETSDCYADGEFGYRLGFRLDNSGEANDGSGSRNEYTYLAAFMHRFEVDTVTLRLLGEASYIQNEDGTANDALFLTGQAALDLQPFTYTATVTQRAREGGLKTVDNLLDFEVLYRSVSGAAPNSGEWSIGAAYTFVERPHQQDIHLIGLRAKFDFSGSIRLGR